MFLRGHGHRRLWPRGCSSPERLYNAPFGILNASSFRSPQCSPQRRPLHCQRIARRFSHIATVAPQDQQIHADPISLRLPDELGISRLQSAFRRRKLITYDQAQHDLGVDSRYQWQDKLHAEQVVALLRLNSGSPSKAKTSDLALYGKHKEDKRLVNQLLKDKGKLSHDWRIPLLQLEQYYRSRDEVAATASLAEDQAVVREWSCKPNRRTSSDLARNIPRPDAWSVKGLLDYVTSVAESQSFQRHIPRVLKPQIKGWSNLADIFTIFEELFNDTAMKRFLSADSCHIALKFFYMYGMMSKARALYRRMLALKMNISSTTFNIMLRGAATDNDLHNFTFLLHEMLRRGHRPDEDTWLSLLMAIDSREVRAIIFAKMKERNVLESPETKQGVAALMIPNELDFHFGSGHGLDTFLDHMDTLYGARWLTTRAANRILSEMIKRRPVSDSLHLLVTMKPRFVPSEVTLNTLLRQRLPSRRCKGLIEILEFFAHDFGACLKNKTYETLFLQAWNTRDLNFARVIWRAACIDGFVTFKMRNLVFQSILGREWRKVLPPRKIGDINAQSGSRSDKFCKIAGDFVVGVGVPAAAECVELGVALQAPKDRSKDISVKAAQQLVKTDELAAGTCRLRVRLPELLRQALELDRKWAADGFWQTIDPQQRIQGGIQVGVEKISAG